MKEVTVKANGRVFVNGVEYVKKEQDIILVPENIKIAKIADDYSKCILFNDNKQKLFVNLETNQYEVISVPNLGYTYKHGELKLTPCNRKDLKCGDLAYRTDGIGTDFTDKACYCLILDENKYVCVIDSGIDSGNGEYPIPYSVVWNYWYKVEEV